MTGGWITGRSLVVLLATLLGFAWWTAGAQGYVYWTDLGAGISSAGAGVGRANLDGSGADPGFVNYDDAGPASVCGNPAVDGSYVYWTDQAEASGATGPNNVMRAPIGGGSPSVFEPIGAGTNGAGCGVAVSGGNVYWVQQSCGSGCSPNSIWVAPENQGMPPMQLVALNSSDTPWGLATDGRYLYWADTAGFIGRVGLDGMGLNESFVPAGGTPKGVAVDSQYIYWANASDPGGYIGRASLASPASTTQLVAVSGMPVGVAVDPNYVYWADMGNNEIGRANLDGSSPNPSFIQTCGIEGIAVDGGTGGAAGPACGGGSGGGSGNGSGGGGGGTSAVQTPSPVCSLATCTVTFGPGSGSWTIPDDVVEFCATATGGAGGDAGTGGALGGYGGQTASCFTVAQGPFNVHGMLPDIAPGVTINVTVGANGASGSPIGGDVLGGMPDGGGGTTGGGGGGGSTTLSYLAQFAGTNCALVAGGGGGAGDGDSSGAAGGNGGFGDLPGQNGRSESGDYGSGAGGAKGAFGTGGMGGSGGTGTNFSGRLGSTGTFSGNCPTPGGAGGSGGESAGGGGGGGGGAGSGGGGGGGGWSADGHGSGGGGGGGRSSCCATGTHAPNGSLVITYTDPSVYMPLEGASATSDGASASLSCPATLSCSFTMQLTTTDAGAAVDARAKKRRAVVIGRVETTLKSRQRKRVKVRLGPTGRRLLKTHRSLEVDLIVKLSVAGGPAREVASRRLTIRSR